MKQFTSTAMEEYKLIPDGYYEVRCTEAEERTTANGDEYISMTFTVRDDVEQPCQNRKIFKSFWKRIEMDNDYDMKKIGQYAAALGVPKGTNFCLADLLYRDALAKISHFTNKNGEDKNCIYFLAPTNNPVARADLGAVFANMKEEGFVETTDVGEDLPF